MHEIALVRGAAASDEACASERRLAYLSVLEQVESGLRERDAEQGDEASRLLAWLEMLDRDRAKHVGRLLVADEGAEGIAKSGAAAG